MRKGMLILIGFLSVNASAIEVKDLRGTWVLKSYFKIENGQQKPWCDRPFGTLSYFQNGRMSVSINCMREGTNEITNDPNDMVFYSGSFSLRQPNQIIHHVQNSSDPERVGKDHIRYADLHGDEVVLTGQGVKGPILITWKRISN